MNREQYIESLYPEEPEYMQAHYKKLMGDRFPAIDPQSGRVLAYLASNPAVNRIFEMGSGPGYSANWISMGLQKGELHLSDFQGHMMKEAIEKMHPLFPEITYRYHEGNSCNSLESLQDEFDLIFIDIDKHFYPMALSIARKKIPVGGLLVFDNFFFHDQVLKNKDVKQSAIKLKAFHQEIFQDKEFQCSVWPVGDGLLMARKIS